MKIKFGWEEINNNSNIQTENWWEATYRAKVIGGWLVRHECAHEYVFRDEEEEWNKRFYTMVFIPDSEHLWEIE